MKLGKRPATKDDRDLKFAKYAAALPTAPSRFGYGTLYPDWGMLGNDNYGDCVFAGAGHETMVWTHIGQHGETKFTAKAVLSDYTAVTGFDPNDPSTDNGTNMRDALNYRRRTGVADSTGKRHLIGAYVALDIGNWHELITASYIFAAVAMGFQFPESAWDQFDQGKTWDVVAGSRIDGGHYVPVVGSMMSATRATCVTWGRRQEFSRRFYESYCDEAYALLSPEQVRSTGKDMHGFDLATLQADLAAL